MVVRYYAPGGYTINIGTFNENTLVSVDPSSSTEFPTRAEAIDTVASLSTASANTLEIPSDTTGNQIQFDDGGHNGAPFQTRIMVANSLGMWP